MHIEHIAIWTNQLEQMKDFYVIYFQAKESNKYHNPTKKFESYFLSFSSGARLELMQKSGLHERQSHPDTRTIGYTHVSFATGSQQNVDELTQRLQRDGFQVMDGPRHTGDGYYESVVLDPDGNHVEITI